MNRRHFLTALATLLAASQLPDVPLVADTPAPVPPVIDWAGWNYIELKPFSGYASVWVNGVEVTPFQSIMQRIAQIVRVNPERGEIGYGFTGLGQSSGAVRVLGVPFDDGDDFMFSFRFKGSANVFEDHPGAYRAQWFDDVSHGPYHAVHSRGYTVQSDGPVKRVVMMFTTTDTDALFLGSAK